MTRMTIAIPNLKSKKGDGGADPSDLIKIHFDTIGIKAAKDLDRRFFEFPPKSWHPPVHYQNTVGKSCL